MATAEFELFALRLVAYGPEAMDLRVARKLLRSPLHWLETRNLLRSYGLSRGEIATLSGRKHPLGCACWECVLALHRCTLDHRNKLDWQVKRKRPPLLNGGRVR